MARTRARSRGRPPRRGRGAGPLRASRSGGSRRIAASTPRRVRALARRTLRWALVGAAAVFLLLVLGIGLVYAFVRVPEPGDIARAQSVTVLDRDGGHLGRIHADVDRVSVPLDRIPQHLRDAVIATEDRRFYRHPGISLPSVFRAALANVVGRGVEQGGSTITQQYVKNAFVGSRRTLGRKLSEAVIALKLERQRSKDEILEDYLNTIYLGRGAYGVEAAARTYFGRGVGDLTLAQSALLAGMIRAPEATDPSRDADAARARRNVVLDLMRRDGFITVARTEATKREPVRARKRRPGGSAPHYLEEVRRELEERIGPRELYAGGVVVRATLDREAQEAAEDAVEAVYDRASDPEVALVAIDPANGEVRAMIGARDFGRRQLNLATRGRRQPGSTFKPFVLAAAFEDGVSPQARFRAPATLRLPTDSGPWTVRNYDRRSHGTISLRRATELSVNTVYARVITQVGPERVVDVAHRLGVVSDLEPLPSLALGTEEVTPLEMTSAFAALAARGSHVEPALVRDVRAGDGTVLWRSMRKEVAALPEHVADEVNQVLQGVIERGTGQRAAIGRPAAGKTGTTERLRDAWFAGYTPDLAAVVWNGYADSGKTLRGVRGRDVVGGSFPAEIWARFMRAALRGVPPARFQVPVELRPGGDPTEPSPSPTGTKTASPSPSPTGTKTASPSPSPTPS